MKSHISITLILAMLLASLAGCGGAQTETSAETVATVDTTPVETETETMYELDDLPADLTFEGSTVTTFGWSGPAVAEFYAEEQNGELVNDAIYDRNLAVEERLSISLEYHLEPGANPDRASWVSAISNNIQAGDGAYDIAAGYSMAGASLAVKNMLHDLKSLQYINLDKPWWPKSLQYEATCGDKLYLCSGDISTYMIYYLYGVYFNKQLVIDHSLENPYDLVKEGSWTFDKMLSMAAGVGQDLNGDGKKDLGDVYGFETHTTYIDPFYFGYGLRTTDKDANDIPVISDLFGGEKTHELLIKLVEFFKTGDGWLEKSSYDNSNAIFLEGRALFTDHEFTYAVLHLRDSDISYGIVPMPKYDEKQKDYYTVMSFPYSLYGIPVDAKDTDMSAAVMECLASESYRTVSPALFESGFKAKYAQDDEASQMFDLIRSTVMFDFGRVFNDNMSSMTYSIFRSAVSDGKTDWISTYTGKEKSLVSALDKVVQALLNEG